VRLVFVTQELDAEHPALAQSVDLVRALAMRVESLAVVTRALRSELPQNAKAFEFGAPSQIRRGVAFERAMVSALRGADGVFVHMVPEFALLAAPAAKARRLPLLLWYTHWNAGRPLRLALPLVDAVLSVDRSSFPLATPKLRPIGHAIDVDRFSAPPPARHGGALRLLALGRTARWKGLGTLLDALALVEQDVHVEIRGPSLSEDELEHRAELTRRIDAAHLPACLLEPIPRAEIPALLARIDVVVSPNEPRAGSTLDKAVFEAAACARPVISTNGAFAPLLDGTGLPLLAPPRDARALAASIEGVAAAGADERARAGAQLRARVVAGHSLDHWADAVLAVVREVRSSRGTAGSARRAAG
jgi:glycosyltransferase involved in cell wall biosynthesis